MEEKSNFEIMRERAMTIGLDLVGMVNEASRLAETAREVRRDYDGRIRVLEEGKEVPEGTLILIPQGGTLKERLGVAERAVVLEALRESGGSAGKTALALGVSTNKVYSCIDKYDIRKEEYHKERD